jgi:hypothetical protein
LARELRGSIRFILLLYFLTSKLRLGVAHHCPELVSSLLYLLDSSKLLKLLIGGRIAARRQPAGGPSAEESYI